MLNMNPYFIVYPLIHLDSELNYHEWNGVGSPWIITVGVGDCLDLLDEMGHPYSIWLKWVFLLAIDDMFLPEAHKTLLTENMKDLGTLKKMAISQ